MKVRHLLALRRRSLALIGLSLLAAAMMPVAASAHFLGGNWYYTGPGVLALSYQNNAGAYAAYSTAINQAASNWYATPTPSDLYSVSGSANITVNTAWDATTSNWGITHIYANQKLCFWWAGCIWYPGYEVPYGAYTSPTSLGSNWSNYQWSTITLFRNTLDSETDFTKTKVATHELGHAQGLAHAINPDCTSVMQQGYVYKWVWNGFYYFKSYFNTPQPHDSYDFDQLYPGSYWSASSAC
jgi:hypothetical protein